MKISTVKDRLKQIQDKISTICKKLGRNPDEITVIGVTKFAPIEKIREAIEAGILHIAESKVQEVQAKFPELKAAYPNLTCHMLGHLQTNKVKPALQLCDLIQSVDSLKLAQEIEKQASKVNRDVVDVLVEVNTSGEEQKYGVEEEQAIPLIEEISKLKRIRVMGLMTMAPYTEDKKIVRECFKTLRQIRDQVNDRFTGTANVKMKYLSMGMTEDYEIAIEEGSNMVRIGRAIFQ